MNETEQNTVDEENSIAENTIEENNTSSEPTAEENTEVTVENTITEENITSETITIENRIDEIAYNTSVISNTGLFFVSFVVVAFVCFLLWKVLDNFISF